MRMVVNLSELKIKFYRYRFEILLFLVFLFALAFRLYFVFQTPYFTDDSAYYMLRQVEHVRAEKVPMLYDELSYGGKNPIVPPLFPYVMAFFSYIPYGLQVVPEVFVCCVVFLVYLIALKMCNNKFYAFMAALMSAFIPVVVSSTLNNLSPFSLLLPLFLLMFYSLINIRSKPYLYVFVILSFLLPLLHPIAIFVVITFVIFYILSLAEGIEVNRLAKEAIVFSIFLVLLIEFLIFKRAFLSLGFNIFWQNIPNEILEDYFKNINLIDIILRLGVAAFVLGVLGLTVGFFREKVATVFFALGAALSAIILLALKLVDFSSGLMLLGIIFALASSVALSRFFKYLKLTKLSKFESIFKFALVLLVFFLMVLPSFFAAQEVIDNSLTDDEFNIINSIRDGTLEGSTVLSLFSEGHYITAIGKRKNVMDSDFLSAPYVNTRYEDVKTMYTTISGVEALQLAEKYNIGYIYFSPRARKFYNIQNLSYVEDEKCFVEHRRSGEVYLYKVRC
ncbi:MAG: hypothetical protein QXR60_00690 [Candidatus Nanoarchaeia archaeon]